MSGCPFHALFGLRKDLPVGIPDRIRNLPVDERGYPVPWFVDWIDGKPEFRAMDGRKFARCINEKLCWVCGERLKKHVAFVIGPMCTITRTSAEPPSHLDCAEWSVKACPFLSKPQMKRREDDLINNENTHGRVAGVAILRNPGVSAIWITTRYTIFPDDNGRPLLEVGDPVSLTWWREGRDATRSEVIASVESGLPLLYNADPTDLAARAEIDRRWQAMQSLLPGEVAS
jgi:hypothetical protein